MTSHARLDKIAHLSQRASELHGDAQAEFVFLTWWQYPFARQAVADALGEPRIVLALWCMRRMA